MMTVYQILWYDHNTGSLVPDTERYHSVTQATLQAFRCMAMGALTNCNFTIVAEDYWP